MDKENDPGRVPELDVHTFKIKPIVKVFVIQNSEGYWLDCGAGEASFVINPKLTSLDNLQPRDIGIMVSNTLEDPQDRDYVPPDREKRLKGGLEDKLVLLSVNFEHAKEFCKTQSRCIAHYFRYSYQLGAKRYQREYRVEFPQLS